MKKEIKNQRVTQKEKISEDNKYYKEMLDAVDGQAFNRVMSFSGSQISENIKMQVNYDLFNNKLNVSDLTYVCQPFGSEVGELPASMVNRDIVSGKLKSIIGMEAKRPFSMACLAINEDAANRKEEAEYNMVRDFVIAELMRPIQEDIEKKYQAETKGRKLTPDEEARIAEQMAQEIQAKTPDQVRTYMQRKHQDPAEILNNQLMRYVMQKENVKDKFSKGLKHALISGREVFMVGLKHNEPFLRVINSQYFDYAKSRDSECIEDSEWGVVELHLSPGELIAQFRKELKEDQVNDIYESFRDGSLHAISPEDYMFDFSDREIDLNSIRVIYSAWKGERKIGWLTYLDDDQKPQMMMVSENYKFIPEMGDIDIEWDWIPETHHGYKICLPDPIYVGLGPYPGQHNDLDNLNQCKLPFIGVDHDDMNSETTSAMDRVKGYQYFYDVILYRIELLMASDKGKILMMNLNSLPVSAGIDIKKFQHFLEANKIAWFDPNDEKNKKGLTDVNTIAKVMDMSLASDMAKYMQMAEYIERKCGQAIGVPENVEGQISADESVRNVQQTISQSSNVLEPTFQLHNAVKRNVLQALVDLCKVGFSQGKPRKISYILDDETQALIDLNPKNLALLADTTTGIFVTDATNAAAAKATVEQLAHAAMQGQQVDLLDVVKVIRSEGITEAEEALQVGTDRKSEQMQAIEQQKQQAAQKLQETVQNHEKEKWQHEADMILLKETERRKTEIQKQTILSLGFNVDKDLDKDGVPDVLEVAKHGVDANIRAREIALAERQQVIDEKQTEKKLDIEKEKNQITKAKVVTT